jgi:transposase
MSRSKINPKPAVVGQVGEGRGRFSAPRKTQAVLRLLKGEDLEILSREVKVTAATLSQWREAFLAAGQASLKSRPADERDEQIHRLKAKVGEMTMEVELLHEKIGRMEVGVPLAARRSKR